MRLVVSLALLSLVTLVSGCGRERTVSGDFRLAQWEDGKTYYLHKRGQDDSSEGGGVIGGIVVRVGWSSRYILAERHSIYRGDADGWMVIDVKSGTISGPFTEAVVRVRPEAQGIRFYDAAEASAQL